VGPKVPVQLIKTHWGSEVQFHSFSTLALDGGSGQTHAPVTLTLGKGLSVPTTQQGGRILELVWTFQRRNKSLAPDRI